MCYRDRKQIAIANSSRPRGTLSCEQTRKRTGRTTLAAAKSVNVRARSEQASPDLRSNAIEICVRASPDMETSDRLLLNDDDDDGHALASPGVHLPRHSLTPTFSNSTDTLFFATSRIHVRWKIGSIPHDSVLDWSSTLRRSQLHRVSLPKPDGAHARTAKNEQPIQMSALIDTIPAVPMMTCCDLRPDRTSAHARGARPMNSNHSNLFHTDFRCRAQSQRPSCLSSCAGQNEECAMP